LARGPEGFTIPVGWSGGGVTFSGPTPTNTQHKTVDIAIQYDNWADSPVNPLNLLAVINANMGQQLHPHYPEQSLNQPGVVDQGHYGDTTYHLMTTPILPLLTPVQQIPMIGSVLADALDAPLRVLVEAGYDRTVSPGQRVPWNPLYMPNPVTLSVNFAVAIPTGIDNAIEDIAGIRPFGTARPGPYGVGGPPVTYVDPPTTTATSQTTESTDSSPSSSPETSTASVKSVANTTNKTDVTKDGEKTSDPNEATPTTAVGTTPLTNPTKVATDPEDTGQSSDALKQDEPVKDSTTASSLPAKGDATDTSKPTLQSADRAPAQNSAPNSTKASHPRLRHPIGSDAPHQRATAPSTDAGAGNEPGSKDGRKAAASNSSDSASSHDAAAGTVRIDDPL
jgi:hypothetical protein